VEGTNGGNKDKILESVDMDVLGDGLGERGWQLVTNLDDMLPMIRIKRMRQTNVTQTRY